MHEQNFFFAGGVGLPLSRFFIIYFFISLFVLFIFP